MLKIIRAALFLVVLGAVLFISAGRLNVPAFWAYLLVVTLVVVPAMLLVNDPDLAKERLRPGPGGLDGGFRTLAAPLVLTHYIIAGLDVGRYGWSAPPPVALEVVALLGAGSGFALILWSMASNTFFSPVVRIQAERGHHVVMSGPYRFVRHPGYLGMVAAFLLSGMALISWWSMPPALAYVGLVLRRTIIEDRFLLEKLPGYRDYARGVRYRLVPGIW